MLGMSIKNGRIIRHLSNKEYKGHIKKNIMTILAICMTTFLIMVILSLGTSYYKTLTKRSVTAEGIEYDVSLPEPTEKQVEIAKNIDGVKYAGVQVKCAVIDEYKGKETRIRLFWADDVSWEKQCVSAYESFEGKYPEKEDEIVLSTRSLSELGIKNPEIGMKIKVKWGSLAVESDMNQCESVFSLSGYYKDFNMHSNGYVSKEFYNNTGVKQTDITNGNLYLSLDNPLYTNDYIKKLGNELELYGNQIINYDPYILTDFIKMMSTVVFLVILIFASGYLFIYNILYISIEKEIQYYGQLKTIGMSGTQLKKYMFWQILKNLVIGVPVGLILGCIIAMQVVPVFMRSLANTDTKKQVVVFHPILLICAAAFSIFVVWLGSRQLVKKLSSFTPVEAMRFVGTKDKIYKKFNKSEQGASIVCMGIRNIFRNKKQFLVKTLSLFVVMISFLVISVIVQGNSAKTVLDKIFTYDARIVNSNLLDDMEYEGLTEELINEIMQIKGVKDIRKVYSQQITYDYTITYPLIEDYLQRVYDLPLFSENQFQEDMQEWQDNPDSYKGKGRIVGIDEKEFEVLNKQSGGKLDKEAFFDDNGAIICGFTGVSAKEVVGKNLTFQIYGEQGPVSLEVINELNANVNNPHYLAGSSVPDLIVSEKTYKELIHNPILELIYVDYSESLDKRVDKIINTLVEMDNNLVISMKTDLYDQMYENEIQLKILGVSLNLVLAILSFMNFGNMTAVNIQNRKNELATLLSIGMTKHQQKKMMAVEGGVYAIISIVTAFIIGIPLSYLVSRIINPYGTPYQFPILENAVFFALMFCFCCVIPVILYTFLQKGSIIDLLKEKA